MAWSDLRAAAVEVAALLLPVTCAGCGAEGPALCDRCRAALRPAPLSRILPGGLRVTSGLPFDGVPAAVLRACKQDGRTGLAGPLAAALAAAAAGVEPPVRFVPVPTSRPAFRRRGYRPVELLMRRAGLPVTRMLRPVRATRDQRALGREERAGNVGGSLRSRPAAGTRVVLVDDVVTTGATLLEARRALLHAGAEVLLAVTVAATPRRSEPAPTAAPAPRWAPP